MIARCIAWLIGRTFCGMHAHYSECAVYEWACERCEFSKFGGENERPACVHSLIDQRNPT